MKKHIPNLFTLGNLFCGCIAVWVLLKGSGSVEMSHFEVAAYFVLTGAFLDFFDGFFARKLGVAGHLGKQLDSLADMVTFGVVPGFIGVNLCENLLSFSSLDLPSGIAFAPLVITLMSAMRLAIFNISTDQSDSFIGLPTPANTLFWIGLPALLEELYIGNVTTIILLSVLSAMLLVSKRRLIALKFKSFGWKGNEARYILILASLVSLITLTTLTGNLLASLPIIILLYLLISVIHYRFSTS